MMFYWPSCGGLNFSMAILSALPLDLVVMY